MRCLILGGGGMLGHRLLTNLALRHDVRVTLRGCPADYAAYGLFHSRNAFYDVDVRDARRLRRVFDEFQPEAVVNAVGLIKQRAASEEHLQSLEINAVLPHRLRELCAEYGARLVHISTDCVFSGRRGGYIESDVPDAEDLYGRTKLLGEVTEAPALTLRTSLIGLELSHKRSLIEWFLGERGVVVGHTRAIFSGITTAEMARLIDLILTEHADVTGLWHVASAPIDKCSLLTQLSERLGRRDIAIVPDDGFRIDRSLWAAAFERRTGYRAQTWDTMLDELANDILARSVHRDAA